MAVYLRAAGRRKAREHNERAWLAWQTARLVHYHHDPKKMPRLATLLVREPHAPRRRQSPAQQLQIVKAMQAAFSAVTRSRKRKKDDGR